MPEVQQPVDCSTCKKVFGYISQADRNPDMICRSCYLLEYVIAYLKKNSEWAYTIEELVEDLHFLELEIEDMQFLLDDRPQSTNITQRIIDTMEADIVYYKYKEDE